MQRGRQCGIRAAGLPREQPGLRGLGENVPPIRSIRRDIAGQAFESYRRFPILTHAEQRDGGTMLRPHTAPQAGPRERPFKPLLRLRLCFYQAGLIFAGRFNFLRGGNRGRR